MLPSAQPARSKHAHRLRHLLLEIEAYAGAVSVGVAQRRQGIARITGKRLARLRKGDSIRKVAGFAVTEKGGDFELARLAPELVPLLDFSDILLLAEGVIETVSGRIHAATGRRRRQIEHAGAQREDALVPLGGSAVGVAPGIARIVERAGIDQRPVHEIGLRIVRVFVGVEHVDNGELADPEDQAVRRIRLRKQVDVGVGLLRLAAEVDRLPNEIALRARVRIVEAELVGFAAREAGYAVRVAKTMALIDLGVEPEFRALPQPDAGEQREVERFPRVACRRKTILAQKWRSDVGVALVHKRTLTVQAKVVRLGCRPSLSDDRRNDRSGVVAELVVQTEAQFLELKIGAHRLRSQIGRAGLAIICEQIFQARGPVPRDRHFNAGSGRPAQPPQERGYVVAGRDLGQRLLIVCPGKSAGGIEQPVSRARNRRGRARCRRPAPFRRS